MVVWSKAGAQILTLFKHVTKQLLALTAIQQKQQHVSLNITEKTNRELSLNPIQHMNHSASESKKTTDQGRQSIRKQDNPAAFPQASQQLCPSVTASIKEDQPLPITKITCSHATKEHISASNVQNSSLESLCQTEMKLLKALVKFVFVLSVVTFHSKEATMLDHQGSQSGDRNTKAKVKEELAKKDIAAERSLLRHFLMEEGIFPLLTQLADLEDNDIKVCLYIYLH